MVDAALPIYLWPDADDEGAAHMQRIGQVLHGTGAAPLVIADAPPDTKGADAADWACPLLLMTMYLVGSNGGWVENEAREREQRRRVTGAHSVYRIMFADGAAYVGITDGTVHSVSTTAQCLTGHPSTSNRSRHNFIHRSPDTAASACPDHGNRPAGTR